MTRILLIEDEQRMAQTLIKGLVKYDFEVDHYPHGLGQDVLQITQYDLILLDWMLPGVSGVDLVKHWRKEGLKTPVLMLTAKSELMDKVQGLEWGADDFLSKFFEWPELIARINALIRRSAPEHMTILDNIRLDRINKEFFEQSTKISLTPTEYSILKYFFDHPRQVVSRSQLVRAIYDYADSPYSNVVERHIKSIRKKFTYDPIFTVRGFGYRLRLNS